MELGPTVPLFGVCMGLQCIGEAFGGEPSNISLIHEAAAVLEFVAHIAVFGFLDVL